MLPFHAGLRQPPSSGSQAFSMSTLLPSHSSATSEVSGKRVREVDARGRRNHVSVAAQRIPRDAFRAPPAPPRPPPRPLGSAAEEGVSRLRHRAEGPHLHRFAVEPWGSQPSPPGSRAPSWRGDTVVRVRGGELQTNAPFSPTQPLGSAPPRLPAARDPRAPAIVS